MRNPFTEHPASVGETYSEHMGVAFRVGFTMIGAGLACVLHGFLPFLFTTTGRDTITRLNDQIVANRVKPENVDKVVPAE